jgi:hypothetical protein
MMINLRRGAAASGYHPGLWFDNVEIVAAKRIGRETVECGSNVLKYYVGYCAAAQTGQTKWAGSAPAHSAVSRSGNLNPHPAGECTRGLPG